MGDQTSTAKWAFNIDALGQGIQRTLSEGIKTRIFCGDSAAIM